MDDRDARVRALWWVSIRDLSRAEAQSALLQALADVDEHWRKEHPEDGLPEDRGIPPDDYIRRLIERIRVSPPAETLA